MIKQKLQATLEKAISRAIADGKLGNLAECPVPVLIERPRLPEHGDFACGVAMKLAAGARMSPIKIADAIADCIEVDSDCVSRFTVVPPGFINFHLGTGWLCEALLEIHREGEGFGRSEDGRGTKVLIEYVSANPTGELHIGHGRGAVFGSCLSNLMAFAGFDVKQAFYLNDCGEQILQLGRCAWALYRRKLGQDVAYPEEGYPEASLSHFLDAVVAENGDRWLSLSDEEGARKLADLTMAVIVADQRQLLERLRIRFDTWFSERALHDKGEVDKALDRFAELGKSYESEGALWLKAKEMGDERDRVLRKSGGATTYLANDAAYHLDKFERGFEHLINIWGADHHGQVPGLKAVVEALGRDREHIEVILTQIVNLSRDGQTVRMSKRMGTVVTLAEVLDEVGVDAVRYYLAESNPQNPINFDLELAKQQSKENPAFYIQYAHARCASILRKALEPSLNVDAGAEEPAPVDAASWSEFMAAYRQSAATFKPLFEHDPAVYAHQKALIMRLESFPEEVSESAAGRTPGRLARYAYDLANDLQKFYESCRVITADRDVTRARLGLIVAMRQVLANVLGIIGVTAPDRM